jgi:hypothetical protein
MIIINLATNYRFQHDINYQYAYGVAALLFFLSLKHLSRINSAYVKNLLCVMMACFSCILFLSTQAHKIQGFHRVHAHPEMRAEFQETREILARIPHDASVTGTHFITPHLSHLRQLFVVDLHYEEFFDFDTEFIIIDQRLGSEHLHRRRLYELRERGYILVDSGGIIEVFRLASAIEAE